MVYITAFGIQVNVLDQILSITNKVKKDANDFLFIIIC